MRWQDAYMILLDNRPIKLPEWDGYWKREFGTNKIFIHDKSGMIFDIRKTDSMIYTLDFTLRNDWEIATIDNCPVLKAEVNKVQQGDFGHAKRLLDAGCKVTCDLFGDNVFLKLGYVEIGDHSTKQILICRECSSEHDIWSPTQTFIMNNTWRQYETDGEAN